MEGRYREWKGDIESGREILRVEGRYRGWKGDIEAYSHQWLQVL